jgi:hypothetical protein
MEFLKKSAKAVVAFLLPLLINMGTDLLSNDKPWPQDDKEWLQYVLSSVVTALGVYGVGNKLSKDQVTSGMEKLPVAEQVQVAKETLTQLPEPVSNKVVHDYPEWASG